MSRAVNAGAAWRRPVAPGQAGSGKSENDGLSFFKERSDFRHIGHACLGKEEGQVDCHGQVSGRASAESSQRGSWWPGVGRIH